MLLMEIFEVMLTSKDEWAVGIQQHKFLSLKLLVYVSLH